MFWANWARVLRSGWSCQIFSAVLLSQSTMSSSRAAKPIVLFGRWYREQEASMWSVVSSSHTRVVNRFLTFRSVLGFGFWKIVGFQSGRTNFEILPARVSERVFATAGLKKREPVAVNFLKISDWFFLRFLDY